MNKRDAKKIAETITNKQLKEMIDAAKIGIKNWTVVSSCNSGITKGTAWNILAKSFDVSVEHTNLYKVNLIREFGDFLPDELKIKKEKKKDTKPPIHQKPILD